MTNTANGNIDAKQKNWLVVFCAIFVYLLVGFLIATPEDFSLSNLGIVFAIALVTSVLISSGFLMKTSIALVVIFPLFLYGTKEGKKQRTTASVNKNQDESVLRKKLDNQIRSNELAKPLLQFMAQGQLRDAAEYSYKNLENAPTDCVNLACLDLVSAMHVLSDVYSKGKILTPKESDDVRRHLERTAKLQLELATELEGATKNGGK